MEKCKQLIDYMINYTILKIKSEKGEVHKRPQEEHV